MFVFISLLATVFLLTVFFTPLFKYYAIKNSVVDKPDNLIKCHKTATPYLGGVAVFSAILIAFLILFLISTFNPAIIDQNLNFQKNVNNIWIIMICSMFIMITGLIDDLKNLSPYPKLMIEFIFAAVIVYNDIQIHIKYFPNALNQALTVFWIVLMTNAANLIDIMDGLCSGVIFIAAAAFAVAGYITDNNFVILLALLVCGGAAGFLIFNFQPASIYLGDAGSLTFGFIISVMSISLSYTDQNQLGILVPILICGIPLFDTFLISYFRIKAGRSPIRGSNDHFALRLRNLGFSTRETAVIIYLISIIIAAAAIVIIRSSFGNAIAIYFLLMTAALVFAMLLSKINPPPEKK